jgi:hypothetical protein
MSRHGVHSRASFAPVRVLLTLALALGLAACGDDETTPAVPEAGDAATTLPGDAWSDPTAERGPLGVGSPDGDVAANEDRTRDGLLKTLHARVRDGRGMGDPAYDRDVRDVAEVLWPANGTAAERMGAQVHVQITAIAAQVGSWFAASESARAERTTSDPVDVKIHAAFLKAAAAGPDAYVAWCDGDGAALLKELAAARRERFFPKK